MSEEIQVTEQSLREALERLGTKSDKKPAHKPDQGSEAGNARSFFSGANSFMNGNSGKKRRFINDGGVVVEHRKDIGRHNSKAGLSGKTVVERFDNGDRQEEILELQNKLAQEQKRTLAAESKLELSKEKIRSLETRLAHYQFQVDELKKNLSFLKDDNVKLRDEKKVVNLREETNTKRKIKIKKNASLPLDDHEQQPVKWWSGD